MGASQTNVVSYTKPQVEPALVERPRDQEAGETTIPPGTAERPDGPSIIIIYDNAFARDCLTRCLRSAEGRHDIWCYSSVEDWLKNGEAQSECVVLLCVTGRRATELAIRRDAAMLKASGINEIIIISDVERLDQMIEALEGGAKAYITMNLSLEVAIEAIHLVRAGGTFVPAAALLTSRMTAQTTDKSQPDRQFTARQVAVIEAIRRGKPNKIIAYELKMGECTVKVHIRNIMKKLKARNRTEIAYLTNNLFGEGDDG